MRKLFPNRIYKSGTGIQWCFWLWTDAQEPYLTRLFLVKTPWFAISLNWIKQADVGHPHDHTSDFLSIFLRGWYLERRIIKRPPEYSAGGNGIKEFPVKDFFVRRRFWNYVRGCGWDAHRILEVSPGGGSLSICFMGPKKREWNYHLEDGTVVHWAKYKENHL